MTPVMYALRNSSSFPGLDGNSRSRYPGLRYGHNGFGSEEEETTAKNILV